MSLLRLLLVVPWTWPFPVWVLFRIPAWHYSIQLVHWALPIRLCPHRQNYTIILNPKYSMYSASAVFKFHAGKINCLLLLPTISILCIQNFVDFKHMGLARNNYNSTLTCFSCFNVERLERCSNGLGCLMHARAELMHRPRARIYITTLSLQKSCTWLFWHRPGYPSCLTCIL